MGGETASRFRDDISIVLCGEAGQGIQTVEHLLTRTLKLAGHNVFSTQEFMSRIRGGSNSTSIRVSSKGVSAPVDRADILIVAPATANIIGKAAAGIADDLVSTTVLTMMSIVPVLMAPAMNNRMWDNPFVQRNVKSLGEAGVNFVGPTEGKLADGRVGMGRMAEVEDILDAAQKILQL